MHTWSLDHDARNIKTLDTSFQKQSALLGKLDNRS